MVGPATTYSVSVTRSVKAAWMGMALYAVVPVAAAVAAPAPAAQPARAAADDGSRADVLRLGVAKMRGLQCRAFGEEDMPQRAGLTRMRPGVEDAVNVERLSSQPIRRGKG